MNSKLTILFFFVFSFSLYAQNVRIYSTNHTYANQKLSVYNYTDFITELESVLYTSRADSSGNIKFEFDIEETTLVFFDLGVYKCKLFVEPNTEYNIIFPDYQPKSTEEKLNPFFEAVEVYVGVKNELTNLNKYIRTFDEIYEDYVNRYRYQLLLNAHNSNVDTFIYNIDSLFLSIEHPYFVDYKYYRFAQLRNLAYQRNTKFATKEHLLFNSFLYHNSAYTSFFNQLYKDYFDHYGRTKEGARIFYDIAYSKSITAAKQTLDKNIALANDTLKELVLLKGIHDAFLNPDWPTNPLLQTLDSVIIQTRIGEHRSIAKNIKLKMTKLRKGFNPPDFELYSQDSILKSLSDYNGKFIYLNFCTSWSFDCQKQFESLKKLQDNYAKYLNIVTISADNSLDALNNTFTEKGYSWDLLHFINQEEIIEHYNVKVFPMYYLIDPEGLLVMNPAPTPEENFEQYFINILKARLKKSN